MTKTTDQYYQDYLSKLDSLEVKIINYKNNSKYQIQTISNYLNTDYSESIRLRINYLKDEKNKIQDKLKSWIKEKMNNKKCNIDLIDSFIQDFEKEIDKLSIEIKKLSKIEINKQQTKSKIEEIQDMSVEELLSGYKYKKSGKEYYLNNPSRYNSNGLSLYINSETGLWNDKVTGESGNKITFWKKFIR